MAVRRSEGILSAPETTVRLGARLAGACPFAFQIGEPLYEYCEMPDERTKLERYVPRQTARRSGTGTRRKPKPSLLDLKLRARRAAKRAKRAKRGKGRRPLGRSRGRNATGGRKSGRTRARRTPGVAAALSEFDGESATAPAVPPDPRFELASLTVELVPRPLWYASNIRTVAPQEDWDLLRRAVYRIARYRCEICGGRGPVHPIECHEVWKYDEATKVQTLERLIGLCPLCHSVKHMGRSQVVGNGEQAMAQLASVNGWPPEIAQHYVDLAFRKWARRSAMRGWRLVVDWDALGARYGVALSLRGIVEYPARERNMVTNPRSDPEATVGAHSSS